MQWLGAQRLERPSIGRGCAEASAPATSRQAATTRSAMRVGGEQRGARAARRAGVRRPSSCGRSAARQACRVPGRAEGAGDPAERHGVDAHGRRQRRARRRPAPRSPRARSPRPAEGTSTALAALTQNGTSAGATPPSVSSAAVAGGRLRAVGALERPGGVGGEQQHGSSAGRGPAGARASARGIGRKRPRSTPTGSTATRRVVARAGEVGGEARARRRPVRATKRQRGAGTRLRARVEEVVAVQRDHHGPSRASSAGQAVSPKWAWTMSKRSPAYRRRSPAGGAQVGGQAGAEHEELDLDVPAPAQRLHLVADERSRAPGARRWVHVRDDERAQVVADRQHGES